MAKKSAIEKNERRRRLVKKYTGKREALRAIVRDRDLSSEDRFAAQLKLAKLPRNANPTRVRNRCNLTGRPRAFYRLFKISRISLRDLAANGMIPGVTKSSW